MTVHCALSQVLGDQRSRAHWLDALSKGALSAGQGWAGALGEAGEAGCYPPGPGLQLAEPTRPPAKTRMVPPAFSRPPQCCKGRGGRLADERGLLLGPEEAQLREEVRADWTVRRGGV